MAGEAAASNEIAGDVAIVGAGLSGLRAAMALDAGGAVVAVLEARDRVGGRLLTVRPHREDSSVFIDHGGQWVSVGQERLTALASELGVAPFPTWGGGATVDRRKGQRSTYTSQFPDIYPTRFWRDGGLSGGVTSDEGAIRTRYSGHGLGFNGHLYQPARQTAVSNYARFRLRLLTTPQVAR